MPHLECLEHRHLLATFRVVDTSDAGQGSFRAAITSANQNPGNDRIEFHIGLLQPAAIVLTAPLPMITGTVTIDATTEPGYGDTPVVQLDGRLIPLPLPANGLHFQTNGSVVQGLAIFGFPLGCGIFIEGGLDNRVFGNDIGLDHTSKAIPNAKGVCILDSPSNAIGSSFTADQNVISGNASSGISILGAPSTGNTIRRNWIGVTAHGTAKRGNNVGILIDTNASANFIGVAGPGAQPNDGNIISGNTTSGIELKTNKNEVYGNIIGTNDKDASGLGNGGAGVLIAGGSENKIGAGRNIISGNGGDGITIKSLGAIIPTKNTILNNFIGLTNDGKGRLGNMGNGILIESGSDTTIGGPGVFGPNYIADNGKYGLHILKVVQKTNDRLNVYNRTIDNMPAPNKGGTVKDESTLTVHDGNDMREGNGIGIHLLGFDSTTVANTIHLSQGTGVAVTDGLRHWITRNSIYNNGGLGIDLGDVGVTLNDYGPPYPDLDTGPNNLQNFPDITSAIWSSGNGGFLDVMSRLESTPNTWFTIEWFGNNACDPSGYGEGEILLFTFSLLTNGFGVAEGGFGITPYARPPSPFYITATATDPDGNTSEFSQCRIVDTESDVTGLSPNSGSTTGGGSVQITGRNFLRITQVLFGSTPATSFRVVNPNLIIATVPPRAAGVVDVRVSGVHGLSPIRPAGRFTYHGGTAPGGGGGLLLEEVFEGVLPALLVPVLPRDSVPRLVGRPTLTEQPVAPPPAPPALAVSAFAVVPWEPTLRPVTSPTANQDGQDALTLEAAFVWQDGDVPPPSLSAAWAPELSGAMARDAVERLFRDDSP